MALLTRTQVGTIELLKVNSEPSGISAVAGSIAIDVTTNTRYRSSGGGSWTPVSPGVLPKPSPPLHASTHIRAGSDQIDADLLDIDFVPTNYTRTTTGTGINTVTSNEHLTAHLKGIDNKLDSITFTPEQYGAAGNGTTDDTTAIQNAYDAAYAIGGVLQFGAKIYKITQPIQTRNGHTTIRGVAGSRASGSPYNTAGLRAALLADFEGTRIYAAGCAAFDRDDTANSHGFMTIENLAIVGDGQDVAAIDFGVGTTNATAYNNFNNVSVFNFGIGFDITNQYGSAWLNCRANSCNVGFQNGYQSSAIGANRAKIDNASVDACNTCFLIIDGSGVEINNVLAQQDCGPLLYLKPRSNGAVNNISISDVHYETSADSRALCVFDGGFGSNSPAGVVSAADILVTRISTNSPSLKDGLKLVNTNDYNGLYRMTWRQVSGINYGVTLPAWAFACRFESCRLNSLNTSTPQDVVVSMCEFGGNYGNNIIKESGVNLLGGGGGTPGGGNTHVQFNDGGSLFGGESAFTYNKTTNTLKVDNMSGSLTRLSDGSSYLRAGGGVSIITSSAGAVTIDAFTLPVINVTKDLTKLGYPSNAVSGINGGGDAIQYAIDYYIANPDKYYAIHIPAGLYYISQPLIIASNQKFVACEIIGTPSCFHQGGGGLNNNPGGPLIAWNSGNKPGGGGRWGVDQPMLVIQGARRVSIQGVEFEGKNNVIPELVDGDKYYGILTASWGDWINNDIRDNPFSPACCVAIDPFMNAFPGGLSSNMYPGLESYYNNGLPSATPLYERSSSNITFKHCSFSYNNFGVVVSPAGPSGTINLQDGHADRGEFIAPYFIPGNDRTQNAENFAFYDCFWNYNRVHYSNGQSQARANNLHSPRMYGGCIAIDNENIAPGGNFGAIPTLSGAPNLGGLRYLFNLNTNVSNFHFSNIYAEWFASVGRINFGHNGDQQGGKFTGCMFDFVVPSTAGSVAEGTAKAAPAMPFHVYHGGGHLEFDTCYFITHDDPLRIHNPRRYHGVLKLNMCQIMNNDVKDLSTNVVKSRAGFAYINDVRIPEIRLRSQKNIFGHSIQEGIGIVGLPQYGTLSEAPPGWLTFTELAKGTLNASGSAGSFTVATSALPKLYYTPGILTSSAAATPPGTGWSLAHSSSLGVGDIANMFLDVYYPEMLTAVAHPLGRDTNFTIGANPSPLTTLCPYGKSIYNGPIGIITGIQSAGGNSTVTVSYLPEAFPFGTAVPIRFSRWDVTLGNFPPPADWPIP